MNNPTPELCRKRIEGWKKTHKDRLELARESREMVRLWEDNLKTAEKEKK